ncbi:TauD/TfdA dioxygenase family protein [Qipengyuania sp.]|uniref:TauD/TfdA dioxygenase family protein n=1 Tax=Qipengyuania sp. TaxID=2004515 RepID=UPI0035C80131
MKMKPLAPECGVEVEGVQLAEARGETLESIKQAIWEHGVAVFRDQELGPEAQIDFARAWGGIDINAYFPLDDRWPEIAVVRKRADQQTNIGGAWHTDHSYDQVPAMGSILAARVLPPTGGDTLFSHMGAAYDALSDDLKARIEDLSAFHTADHVYQEGGIYAQTDQGADLRGHEVRTGATHPVVIRHPRTGRRLLYVNPSFTIHFTGQTGAQSLPLMQELWAEAMKPAHQCRVVWQPGTVTIWDNRTTWHNALNDYQGHARELHRITLTGEPLAA